MPINSTNRRNATRALNYATRRIDRRLMGQQEYVWIIMVDGKIWRVCGSLGVVRVYQAMLTGARNVRIFKRQIDYRDTILE